MRISRLASAAKLVAFTLAALVMTLVASRSAGAGSTGDIKFEAVLAPGSVVPRPQVFPTDARGRFTARLELSSAQAWPHRFKFRLTFIGLTGPASSVAIRFGGPEHAGVVFLWLCHRWFPLQRCPAGRRGVARGLVWEGWVWDTSVPTGLTRRNLYVEIATEKNPLGELRGQLRVVRRGG